MAPRPEDLDLAFGRARWRPPGSRDVRVSRPFKIGEFPWPIRVHFVVAEDEDANKEHVWAGNKPGFGYKKPNRFVPVGIEIGDVITDADERDTDEYELTAERWAELPAIQSLIELGRAALFPTSTNLEIARQERTSHGERGRSTTPAYLARIGRIFNARSRERGIISRLAAEERISPKQMRRDLERAEEEGFVDAGKLQRRRRAA